MRKFVVIVFYFLFSTKCFSQDSVITALDSFKGIGGFYLGDTLKVVPTMHLVENDELEGRYTVRDNVDNFLNYMVVELQIYTNPYSHVITGFCLKMSNELDLENELKKVYGPALIRKVKDGALILFWMGKKNKLGCQMDPKKLSTIIITK